MASKLKPATTETLSGNGSLPKGWRMVRFGDVVRDVNEAERNPLEAGLERFVGLEHIEPENLHIKKWGNLADGAVSFTKRFRKGQVLFGKRRAYQRKVAVPTFDGICSSDILTLEPKSADLLPELLPFIVQSDGFFEYALDTSSGSLSPRTRWSQLQDYEFPLPPKEEQRNIADTLWAADDVIEASKACREALRVMRSRFVEEQLDRLDCEHVALRDLWTESPESGFSPVPAPSDTGHYVLILSALSQDGYVPGNLKPVKMDERVKATTLMKGDLLVSRSNTVDLVGLVGVFNEDRSDVSFPDLMMRVSVNQMRIDSKYLELVMLSPKGRRHMQRVAAGTSGSMKKINRVGLGSLSVPLPSLPNQHRFLKSVVTIDNGIKDASQKLFAEQELKKALCRQLLPTVGDSHVH